MRYSISVKLVALVAGTLFVAGCGGRGDTGSTSPGAPPPPTSSEPGTGPTTTADAGGGSDVPKTLAGRTWQIVGIITVGGAQPVPSGVEATLTIASDGTVDVEPGCNIGSGDASFDGNTVSVSVAVTEMACTDEDRMNVEQAVLAVLGSPMRWNVVGDTLTLTPTDVSDSGLQLLDSAAPPDTTADAAPADDRAAVLAAVAANRVFTDNSFGGATDVFDSIGIIDAVAISGEGRFAQVDAGSPRLSSEERKVIEDALSPLPVRWIEPGERTTVTARIMNGTARIGALVTLTEPEIHGATATAVSELYCGSLCAIGGAHELERQPDGTWTVTGPVGPQWIS